MKHTHARLLAILAVLLLLTSCTGEETEMRNLGGYTGNQPVRQFNQTFRKAVVSAYRTPPQSGDMRIIIGMDPDGEQIAGEDALEFTIQRYNGSAWEDRGRMGQRTGTDLVDLLISGYIAAGEKVLSSSGLVWLEGDLTEPFTGSTGSGYAIAQMGSRLVFGGISGTISYSDDYGASWTAATVPGVLNNVVYKIVVIDEDTAVATSFGADIVRTTDGGENWSDVTPTGVTYSLRYLAHNGSGTMLATEDYGLDYWRSTDYGATWTNAGAPPTDPTELIWDPTNDVFIMGGASTDDTYISPTGAAGTWTSYDSPFKNESAGSRAFFGLVWGNNVVYASNIGGKVSRSTDGGRTWSIPIDVGLSGSSNRLVYGDDILMIAGYAGGGVGEVFISADGGFTWREGNMNVESMYSMLSAMFYDYQGTKFWIARGKATSGTTTWIRKSEWLEAGAGIIEVFTGASQTYHKFSNGFQITVSDSSPSGGQDGDIWLEY
jgi:photosystem II stability/assembly factor-like uncharacterized protein